MDWSITLEIIKSFLSCNFCWTSSVCNAATHALFLVISSISLMLLLMFVGLIVLLFLSSLFL